MSKKDFLLGVFVIILIVAGVIVYLLGTFTTKVTNSIPAPTKKADVDISASIKEMADTTGNLKNACSDVTDKNFDTKTDVISQNLNSYAEKINFAISSKNLSENNFDSYTAEINNYITEFNTCYTKLNRIVDQLGPADQFKTGQLYRNLGELQRQYGEIQRLNGDMVRKKGETKFE